MPNVLLDSTGDGGGSLGGVNTVSFNHTCNTDAYLVVGVAYFSTSTMSASATYNGDAMVSLGKRQFGGTARTLQVEFFGLSNPDAGSHNVQVDFTGVDDVAYGSYGAISFTQVNQSSPSDGFVYNEGNDITDLAVSVTSDVLDATVSCLLITDTDGNDIDSLDIGHNFFMNTSGLDSFVIGAGAYTINSGTYNHNFTWNNGSGTDSAVLIGVNIKHASDNNPRGFFAVL